MSMQDTGAPPVSYTHLWKTYMSSAKMRVLKPKIDESNKKYPKQEDAMKKQQEVMGLYSQYGVSPVSYTHLSVVTTNSGRFR